MLFTRTSIFIVLLLCCTSYYSYSQNKEVQIFTTSNDKQALFTQSTGTFAPEQWHGAEERRVIGIDAATQYQMIDGFGFALTGGSAQHLVRMSSAARHAVLQELFGVGKNDIGFSYLRVSIGASDLNDHVFTYDDMPDGQTDTALTHFDLKEDKQDVIPVLKEILAINPTIKILGSPWTAPAWMKTNNNVKGGSLKKEYYGVYARYFVKYIQSMKAQGITIDAVTLQNEPLNPKNTPSMVMQADEQRDFIKNDVGPLFRQKGIKTKIILYDHNCDVPEYAIAILNDKDAAQYVDGSGFHLYGGEIESMSAVHNTHPDKHLYFTEQMVIDLKEFDIVSPVSRLIIGATRNWSRNVLLWNLAADKNNEPHTDNGGCPFCQGAITIDGDSVGRNVAYYTVAHASKFIRPGSVRIASNSYDQLPNAAFKTPEGKIVLIVANTTADAQTFNVVLQGKTFTATLTGNAVATYVF
ncbi:glucosylceramidase [Ilyomonas limi]|uniref:Glucosylceramidase n=1 Tax=Ilyomonas limi TaxID=2575867 RepID=A0A4U3KYG3_9BACT|nr:glycoside hydrolase family 30 beta sandwich domain-containing protein [Ilyomonas limi]TKK67412.1 glucosylceramidase [Ilyomonas limi]